MMRRAWQCLLTMQFAAVALILAGCKEKSSQGAPTETAVEAASTPRQSKKAEKRRQSKSEEPRQTEAQDTEEQEAEGNPDPILGIGYVDSSDEEADDEDSGVVVHNREKTFPGYNLIEVVKPRLAELRDMDGKLLNVWHHGDTGQWERCVLLPDGDLLVISFTNPHFILRLNWNNEVVWQRDGLWHHDLYPMADGSIAALRWEYRRIESVHADVDSMDNIITRFDPQSQSEEHRSLYDILSSKPDLFKFQEGRLHEEEGERKERIDLIHANSLWPVNPKNPPSDSPIYKKGNMIVSCRHQDSAIIFNWETSELLWAWGQGELEGPHDAQVLDNGNVLIFDNGRDSKRSRVLEVNPLTKEIVWKYVAPRPRDFFSTARGSNQRMPNGNTLITESNRGRVFEVTPEGKIVWKYYSPHRDPRDKNRIGALNRCYRYDPAMIDPLIKKFGTRTEPGAPATAAE